MRHCSIRQVLALFVSWAGIGAVWAQCPTADPSVCRMVITSQTIADLDPTSMDPSSDTRILMNYDVQLDPDQGGVPIPWLPGVDATGMTVYDYTLPAGCLGLNGPLGYLGPLSSEGDLPNRVHGTTRSSATKSWANGWCDNTTTTALDTKARGRDNSTCVYGPGGPLGESGPLNPNSYYDTMYHLQQGDAWWQDYNVHLDAAGVWAVQGPLGPTGAMGPLGPLGPLGISPQPGMTTLPTGVYEAEGYGIVRTTAPLQYSADGSTWRAYDLYEMYNKSYAQAMPDNDCSFAVDSYEDDPAENGDGYLFHSNHSQFVSVLVTPVHIADSFAFTVLKRTSTGNWTLIAQSLSDSTSGGLINWASFRALPGETYWIVVVFVTNSAPVEAGYYLYVTGSGLYEGGSPSSLASADVWGPRPQITGPNTFNIIGQHQNWVPY
jgi:hypothetical protein